MNIFLALLLAAPASAQSDLSVLFGGAEAQMRAAKELQRRMPASAPAIGLAPAPIAQTVAKGSCTTSDEENPQAGMPAAPSCSVVFDPAPGARGGSSGVAVVYLDASRRPSGAWMVREKKAFPVGKGALSGQEFWAVESLYWTLDAAGRPVKAERFVPALYNAESECPTCKYFDRYLTRAADGSETRVLVGRKPAPVAQSDFYEAVSLWWTALP